MSATAFAGRLAKLSLQNEIYERTHSIPLAASRASDLLEHFYDRGVVWSFEIQKQTATDDDPR